MRGAAGPVLGAMVAWACACGGAGESLDAAPVSPQPMPRRQEAQSPTPATPAGTPIRVQTADGVLLSGTMWPGPERKKGSDRPNGAVVLLHQLGSDRSEWHPYVVELVDRYTVIAIDLRGHGKSTARVDGPALDYHAFEDADWALLTNDVRAVIDYVTVVEPEGTPITLVGSSIGSTAVLLYAASNPDIYAVAMLSPGLSYGGMDTQLALSRYGARPILMLAAEGDRASAMATRRLAELAENRTVKVYKGDGHGVSMEGPVRNDVVEFVRRMPTRVEPPAGSDTTDADPDADPGGSDGRRGD